MGGEEENGRFPLKYLGKTAPMGNLLQTSSRAGTSPRSCCCCSWAWLSPLVLVASEVRDKGTKGASPPPEVERAREER